MDLPVPYPVSPMLAKLSRTLPEGAGLIYEPKWDGFRTVVFRDGAEIELGSRNERPLTRYFPEVVAALATELPPRCVVDGEIVIAAPGGLDFEALLNRIHPAASRIAMLSERTPAAFVAFDLLALGDADLRATPFSERRRRLEESLGGARPPVYVTPASTDPHVGRDWFSRFEGAGLDGVVVKSPDLAYLPGERVMVKVKHERTADCVVGGFRWHKSGGVVGSLLLGLYDEEGVLHHAGVASGFSAALRAELVDVLAPLRTESLVGHPWAGAVGDAEARRPGGTSRWSAGRDLSWEPLRPERVAEVGYDHLQGDRFRNATSFRRWRPDRDASSCTYAQLDTVAPAELAELFGQFRVGLA